MTPSDESLNIGNWIDKTTLSHYLRDQYKDRIVQGVHCCGWRSRIILVKKVDEYRYTNTILVSVHTKLSLGKYLIILITAYSY